MAKRGFSGPCARTYSPFHSASDLRAEAVKQPWQYLADDLAPKQRQGVDEHLGICWQCCDELEFAKLLPLYGG